MKAKQKNTLSKKIYLVSNDLMGKKILFIFMLLTLSGVTLVFATYKGFFDIQKLEIQLSKKEKGLDHQGLKVLARKNLKAVLGETLFGVSLKKIYQKVITDPRIKSINVKRRFPNQLTVEIEPLKPKLALMSFQHGLHIVSQSGKILPVKYSEQNMDLPILRGANFHQKLGLRQKAIRLLEDIPDQGIFSRQNISEIRYDEKNGFSLFLVHRQTLVKLGQDFSPQKSSYIERAMSYLESQRMEGRVIDARFSKKVVVKLRNEP